MTLKDLNKQFSDLKGYDSYPVLFVGHGSPMNAIEENEFSKKWAELGKSLPVPKAILCISAHWETNGSFVTAMQKPKTIHDFYDFPEELYQQQYPSLGDPTLANEIVTELSEIELDHQWGLDHGTWSILKHIYPKADIPVLQLSIDRTKGLDYHYQLAQQLSYLRSKGVLIIGSGNMIHNLRMLRVGEGGFNAEFGYDWAMEQNEIFKTKIDSKDHKALVNVKDLDSNIRLSIPSFEHYIPLLYVLGLQGKSESSYIFNDKVIAGALSMTSVIIA